MTTEPIDVPSVGNPADADLVMRSFRRHWRTLTKTVSVVLGDMNAQGGIGKPAALVPAIDTASSTAAVRSLGKWGVKTVAVSEHDHPPAYSSRYCDERIAVTDPNVDLDAYGADLLSLARRNDVRTVLPFREADVYVLARDRTAFEPHVTPVWPDLETLRRVQDRIELARAAEAASVAMPRTTTVDAWDNWDCRCVIKPRYTVHATEYADAFSENSTETASTRYVPAGEQPDLRELHEEMGHLPIVQEYVPTSDEYGFFALYDHGTPVATFQHRQRRGWKYSGGPSAYREAIDDPELEAAGRRLLDELDWHGVAMVEFLENPETGEFELMEVNPRFWSSLPFTVQAGVNFPALYWQLANDEPTTASKLPTVGMSGHLLRGELLYLHSILTEEYPLIEPPAFAGAVRDVVASVLRHRNFDYLSVDDPGPFVRDVTNTVRTVADTALPDRVPFRKRSTELETA